MFSYISGQARTLIKRRWCDPQLRQAEPVARPPRSMVGHSTAGGTADTQGLWCWVMVTAVAPCRGFTGVELSACWEVLGLWFYGQGADGM